MTMAQHLGMSRLPAKIAAFLLAAFALVAMALAAIGVYGLVRYSVAKRSREIGIRMALGAARGSVLAGILKQGLTFTGAGVIAGIAAAFVMTRLMTTLLFGVQPTDPFTLVTVVATIAVVAVLACAVPAHRATRVDPVVVLRDE